MLNKTEDIYRVKSIITSASASNEQADKLFGIFVAMAAAMSVDLPATRMENIENFIVENKVDQSIKRFISPVNEVCIINFAEVRRLAMQFYTFRYAMAYGGLDSMAFAFAAFTGCSGDIIVQSAKEALNTVQDNAKINEAFNLAMRVALGGE